jgi:CheY-like chemotaxis protein
MRRKNKLLVVDDNSVNLSILEEMLIGEYRIAFAQNGPDAIRAAKRFQPAYMLLDVMMPGIDGLEICRQIRATPGLRDMVIIMVSAKAMPSEQAAGIAAGADDYITKPFDEVELLEILHRYSDPHANADSISTHEQDEADEDVHAASGW